MTSPHTTQPVARADWTLMTMVLGALRPRELGAMTTALRGGRSIRCAGTTVPWALTDASPDVRAHVLSQLPAPARLLYRTVWLPRYVRATGPL